MKLSRYFLFLVLVPLSAPSLADSGRIIEIYAHPIGSMALKLDNGLPISNARNDCGSPGNPWAGVGAADHPSIKAAILAAYTAKSTVTLVTMGTCVGNWIKIEAMHVN